MVTGRQLEVICTMAIMTTVSTTILALRVYNRIRIKGFGLDDWLVVAAYAWTLINGSGSLLEIRYGSGKHDKYISKLDYGNALKATYYWRISHLIALCLIKLSILAFFLRLSVEKSQRVVIYIVGTIVVTGTLMLIGINIFQCHPMTNVWNPIAYPQGCISIKSTMSGVAVFHIITDMAIYLMPMPVILRLHVSTRRKWGLLSIFVVGAIPVAASIGRFYTFATFNWTKEVSYQGARVSTWTILELNATLLAACMPALKSIFWKSKRSSINTTPMAEIAIPLSLYPSNLEPALPDSNKHVYPYTTELVVPELPHVNSGSDLRNSESQECIVKNDFEYSDRESSNSQV